MAKAENCAPTSLYGERRSFAKIPDVMDVPNLISIQTDSFKWFMEEGITEAFNDVCPIENATKDMCVELGAHKFGDPKYTVDECKEKDARSRFPPLRFASSIAKPAKLAGYEVLAGGIPLSATPRGTSTVSTHGVVALSWPALPACTSAPSAIRLLTKLFSAQRSFLPAVLGSNLRLTSADILCVPSSVSVQPATLLLRALGIAETREEIVEVLGSSEMVLRTLDRDPATTKDEALIELYKRFRPGEPPTIDSARTLLDGLFFNPQRYDLAKVGRQGE